MRTEGRLDPVAATDDPADRCTMRAIVQGAYGGADVLQVARIDMPTIAQNEVLLQVRAASLDRGTWHLMAGVPYLLRLGFGFRAPKNPVAGQGVAGVVAAVGKAVTRFSVGDEVFGIARGSFAEYAAATEGKLARKPAAASFEQAAVATVSALTALQALRDAGRVRPGQQVLIIGASGGVGSYAVQLAKALGAEVTGVCSAAKVDLVRSLGADHTVDYTRADFADGSRRYDLVVDLAGNPTLSRLRRALTPTGTAVIAGGEEGGRLTGGMNRQLRALALSPFVGQRLTMLLAKECSADLEALAGFIESGAVTSSIDRAYPLERVPEAMRHLVSGNARGKIAVTV